MSGQVEDDWEAAEVNIKALEIKGKVSPAPKLLLKPPIVVQPVDNGAPSPNTNSDNPLDVPVDAALLNALTNPRERMVVFQIENNILNFMNSPERTMDIPPGYNSFRRLLAYRIGQRFGLSHTTSDQLSENGERGIVLYKTSATGFPSLLLIDMNTTCTPVGGGGGGGDSDQADTSDQASPAGAASASAGAAPRKVMVMKRKPNKNEQAVARATVRQAQSSEDKEKAYLEARARIFGDAPTPEGSCSPVNSAAEESGTGTPKSDTGDLTAATSTGAGLAHMSKNSSRSSLAAEEGAAPPLGTAAGIASGGSLGSGNKPAGGGNSIKNSGGKKAAVPTSVPASASGTKINKSTSNSSLNSSGIHKDGSSNSNSRNPSGSNSPVGRNASSAQGNMGNNSSNNNSNNTNNSSNNNNERRPVDAGNWKGNRSQVRNIDAERSDPDFVRRNVSANSNSNSGGSRNQQARGANDMQMQPGVMNANNMPLNANYMDPMQLQMQQMHLQYQHQQMQQMQMQMQMQHQQAMLGMSTVPMPMPVPNLGMNNNMPPPFVPVNMHSMGNMSVPVVPPPPPPFHMDPQQYHQYMMMMQAQQQQQQAQQMQHQQSPQGNPATFNSKEFPPLG